MKSVLLFISLLPFISHAQVTFVDVADQKGITYQGKTFGSSWGDIDGNGFQDLFLSCHANRNDLYYTNDEPVIYFYDGTVFTPTIFPDFGPVATLSEEGETIVDSGTDWHGGAFFDFDRDGDLDKISMRGGTGSNAFYLNNSGIIELNNRAADYNLEYVPASGRTPGILDINQDGYTDLIVNAIEESQGPNVPRLMTNESGETFIDKSTEFNLMWPGSVFSTTNDFQADGGLDIVSLSSRATIYQVEEGTLNAGQEISSSKTADFLIEDLNGDLLPDIFSVRSDKRVYVEMLNPSLIRSNFRISASVAPISFEFTASSDIVNFIIYPRSPNVPYVLVIGNEINPEVLGEQVNITLNATDPGVVGNPTIELDSPQPRIYINFDPILEKWTVTAKSGLGVSIPFGLEIESSDLVLTDNFPQGPNLGAELFYNTGDYSFVEQSLSVFEESDNFESVVAADFDNDMDIDLYAVRSNYAKNKENVLWENDNNLSWVRHDGAWGALGNGEGIGESVTTIDYNNDGFMDLYVTNGSSIFWLEEASTNLYENQADNGNNWLKVQLEGVISTPTGLHTRVILHAGGVSQLRYQHGGMHRYSQNDTRLHFGLAQNTTIDSLEVFWPSGIRQVIKDTEVNLILTITEETPCEIPYPEVSNLNSSILPNGVLLEWDPIPGSIGCQIQGGLSFSPVFQTFQILEPAASEFFASQGQLQNGEEYRWRVRCGCTTSIVGPWSEIDYFTWPSVGLRFNAQVEHANLFPNPAHADLFVDIRSFENKTYEMRIFDFQGRMVKEKVGEVGSNQMLRFDISDLDVGVYLVRISDDSSIITEKIIKQ